MVVGVEVKRQDGEEETLTLNSEQPNIPGGGLVSTTTTLSLLPVRPSTIPQLRSINSILFPMDYQERYYKEVLALDSFSHFVYWGKQLVGTFTCRMQSVYIDNRPFVECYIMTLGVLAVFRRLKFGSYMLQTILKHYEKRREVIRIVLHVHTINEIALNMYRKFGFKIVAECPEYYKKLQPSSAYLLQYEYARTP